MIKAVESICHLLEAREDFVLATIVAQTGSTPRMPGTKMIIRSDGTSMGTIGGGLVEAEVMRAAPKVFESRDAHIRSFDLTYAVADTMDMICGGRLEVLLEYVSADEANLELFQKTLSAFRKGAPTYLVTRLDNSEGAPAERCLIHGSGGVEGETSLGKSEREALLKDAAEARAPLVATLGDRRYLVEPCYAPATVYLFGAGHVSQQVARLTAMTGFRTVVLDDRMEFANRERFDQAEAIKVLDSFENAMAGLDINEESYLVIVTRGHSHDKTVLAQALGTEAGYIGMIGSKRKRNAIYQALSKEGFTREDLARVHCPIGLPIGAETPEEIALSIAAELVQERAGKGRESEKVRR